VGWRSCEKTTFNEIVIRFVGSHGRDLGVVGSVDFFLVLEFYIFFQPLPLPVEPTAFREETNVPLRRGKVMGVQFREISVTIIRLYRLAAWYWQGI
jgi:hypothetical protein